MIGMIVNRWKCECALNFEPSMGGTCHDVFPWRKPEVLPLVGLTNGLSRSPRHTGKIPADLFSPNYLSIARIRWETTPQQPILEPEGVRAPTLEGGFPRSRACSRNNSFSENMQL